MFQRRTSPGLYCLSIAMILVGAAVVLHQVVSIKNDAFEPIHNRGLEEDSYEVLYKHPYVVAFELVTICCVVAKCLDYCNNEDAGENTNNAGGDNAGGDNAGGAAIVANNARDNESSQVPPED